jgi:hypothetical protein
MAVSSDDITKKLLPWFQSCCKVKNGFSVKQKNIHDNNRVYTVSVWRLFVKITWHPLFYEQWYRICIAVKQNKDISMTKVGSN